MKTKAREKIDEWWDSTVYDRTEGRMRADRRKHLFPEEYLKEEEDPDGPVHPRRRESDREAEEKKGQSEFL
ncbi:MAG: hypothetical protein WCT49_02270 [Candidatus Paceibacterota bacterium]|jgi:hypothetical protein|nr:hypothetical protein [Candidatus Paceibacterota bacterium]